MKLKINIIDIFVLLGIVVFLIILLPNFVGGKKSVVASGPANDKTVYFTVELPGTTLSFGEKISVGDKINDNIRGYYYGVVDKVQIIERTLIKPDMDAGRFVKSVIPNQYDVWVTVKCNGSESATEIRAEDQIVKFGKQMSIKGKGYAATGFVVDLSVE